MTNQTSAPAQPEKLVYIRDENGVPFATVLIRQFGGGAGLRASFALSHSKEPFSKKEGRRLVHQRFNRFQTLTASTRYFSNLSWEGLLTAFRYKDSVIAAHPNIPSHELAKLRSAFAWVSEAKATLNAHKTRHDELPNQDKVPEFEFEIFIPVKPGTTRGKAEAAAKFLRDLCYLEARVRPVK